MSSPPPSSSFSPTGFRLTENMRRVVISIIMLAVVAILLGGCSKAKKETISTAPDLSVQDTATSSRLVAVESISIQLLESFPVQVRVIARGVLPDDCTQIDEVQPVRLANRFHIAITSQKVEKSECHNEQVPFQEMIMLDTENLPAGVYIVDVNGLTDTFELTVDNSLRSAEVESMSTPSPEIPSSNEATMLPEAVYVVQGMVAQQLGVSPGDVDVVGVEPQEWPDSCLGLAAPDESCLQEIVPGYRITLDTGEEKVVYRSNESGSIVRKETAPAPSPTPTAVTVPTNCIDQAEFVADVTVKDSTRIAGNQEFIKTWRLLNTGTCTWTPDYQVVFTGGDQMGGASSAPLGQTVAPGATADISVRLVAPALKGTYTSSWMLQNPAGKRFGIGRKGEDAFWVKIVVPKDASRKGAIQGHVWHDLCANAGLSGESPPPGCRIRADGSYIADGIRDENEPPIGGAVISLGAGACPSSGLINIIVDAKGFYKFTELAPGDYCVSIDPASDHNQPIFLPGEWSFPKDGQHTITLAAGETRKDIDFGWDYQFSP
ncbi:MAG: hypothetical protein GXP38_06810 [Chloroflexi bacterium]|nr:hypothetical protein [Chloroflexota bacterium]